MGRCTEGDGFPISTGRTSDGRRRRSVRCLRRSLDLKGVDNDVGSTSF